MEEQLAEEAREPREVFDFRGNKRLDLGFSNTGNSSEAPSLTWQQLKAVRSLPSNIKTGPLGPST